MGIRSYSTSEANNIQLGQAGADYVTNATVNSDTYIAIQALSTDCEISATSADTDVWDSLSSITVLKGQTIYGRWSSVTVASGDFAMVYRG
jgi:hypothetical protein